MDRPTVLALAAPTHEVRLTVEVLADPERHADDRGGQTIHEIVRAVVAMLCVTRHLVVFDREEGNDPPFRRTSPWALTNGPDWLFSQTVEPKSDDLSGVITEVGVVTLLMACTSPPDHFRVGPLVARRLADLQRTPGFGVVVHHNVRELRPDELLQEPITDEAPPVRAAVGVRGTAPAQRAPDIEGAPPGRVPGQTRP